MAKPVPRMLTTANSRKKTIPKMIAAIAGQGQVLLGPIGERGAGDPGNRSGQASGQRAHRPLQERHLELELLQVLGLHGAELGEPGLDGVDGSTARQAKDDQQDCPGSGRGDKDDRHDQTSMSTILRMNMKPMNIMNPPKIRMMTPAGRPAMLTESSNIGAMKPGAAMNRKPARPIGSKPTT